MALAGLALAVGSAHAAVVIDFDSYSVGDINLQGPWVDFGGSLTSDVSTTVAFSGTQSLELKSDAAGYGSDVYIVDLNGAPVTSGQWNLSFQTYLPTGFDSHLALYQSQGAMPADFFVGAFPVLQGDNGVIVIEASSTPLVFGAWAKVEMLIDLDADTLAISYDGTPFHSGAWDTDATGTPSIGGLDWWAAGPNPSSGVSAYIDDLSLTQVPEPATMGLLSLGALLALKRRRRAS